MLDSSAHLVEHPVSDPDHVERISDRVAWERCGLKPAPVGLGQVERHARHCSQPALRALGAPSAQLGGTFSFEEVDHDAPVQVDQTVA